MSLSVENIFQLSGINLEANLTTPNSQLIQEPPRNSQLNNELLEKEQEEFKDLGNLIVLPKKPETVKKLVQVNPLSMNLASKRNPLNKKVINKTDNSQIIEDVTKSKEVPQIEETKEINKEEKKTSKGKIAFDSDEEPDFPVFRKPKANKINEEIPQNTNKTKELVEVSPEIKQNNKEKLKTNLSPSQLQKNNNQHQLHIIEKTLSPISNINTETQDSHENINESKKEDNETHINTTQKETPNEYSFGDYYKRQFVRKDRPEDRQINRSKSPIQKVITSRPQVLQEINTNVPQKEANAEPSFDDTYKRNSTRKNKLEKSQPNSSISQTQRFIIPPLQIISQNINNQVEENKNDTPRFGIPEQNITEQYQDQIQEDDSDALNSSLMNNAVVHCPDELYQIIKNIDE